MTACIERVGFIATQFVSDVLDGRWRLLCRRIAQCVTDAWKNLRLFFSLRPRPLPPARTCPITLNSIPIGQEFVLGDEVFDVDTVVKGLLAPSKCCPVHPTKRSPLSENELQCIVRKVGLSTEEFRELWSEAQARADIELVEVLLNKTPAEAEAYLLEDPVDDLRRKWRLSLYEDRKILPLCPVQ